MDTTLIVMLVLLAVAAVGAAIAWYLQTQARRRRHPQDRFGPEYERTRAEIGDTRRAEAVLAAREERVEKLHIRPLSEEETTRFSEVWRHVQALFVDDPGGATAQADRLVNDVMSARGYPVGDFARRAADISVDHPKVVQHYRAARDIADRQARGSASTEDLRQGMIHYRALFDDLLAETPIEKTYAQTRR
jgi:hypothetical protein